MDGARAFTPTLRSGVFRSNFYKMGKEVYNMSSAKKGDIILFQLIKKRKDLTYEQFRDYWLNKHNKIEQEIIHKGLRKKIVAHFVKGVLERGELVTGKELPFDAVLELHYNSVEDMKASFDPEIAARLRKDEENFLDMAERIGYILEEYVMAERTK